MYIAYGVFCDIIEKKVLVIMFKIQIDFLLFCYDEQKFDSVGKEIMERFHAKSFSLNLLDSDVPFKSSVTYNVEDNAGQSRIIDNYKRYLKLHPNNDDIKRKLAEKEQERDRRLDIILSLYGELDADVSIEDNTIYLPSMKRYSLEEIVERDLCEYLLSYHVDEFYDSLRQQISGCFIAILLSSTRFWNMIPGAINVYFNDALYQHDRIVDRCRLRDDDLSSIIPLSELDISDCWKWIKKNTSIGSKEHSPVYFTALSYLFNRYDYEALMFAVLGLESLLVKPNSKYISDQFQKNLRAIFNTLDEASLKKIYKIRSKFVHGETEFSILDSFLEYDNDDSLDDAVEMLTLALVEMVRLLIKNDATKFRFHENVTYDFIT